LYLKKGKQANKKMETLQEEEGEENIRETTDYFMTAVIDCMG
jgi:hypothetical protein